MRFYESLLVSSAETWSLLHNSPNSVLIDTHQADSLFCCWKQMCNNSGGSFKPEDAAFCCHQNKDTLSVVEAWKEALNPNAVMQTQRANFNPVFPKTGDKKMQMCARSHPGLFMQMLGVGSSSSRCSLVPLYQWDDVIKRGGKREKTLCKYGFLFVSCYNLRKVSSSLLTHLMFSSFTFFFIDTPT